MGIHQLQVDTIYKGPEIPWTTFCTETRVVGDLGPIRQTKYRQNKLQLSRNSEFEFDIVAIRCI